MIGQYLDQIDELAEALNAPKLTGATPIDERERLYQEFREGITKVLVVSKVANFSVDLPEATVAIQVSGSFGSRQEEAQRLGRLLRPKESGLPANFYTLVARDTVDQDFAQNRQRFLAEQGYSYTILDADDLAAAGAEPPPRRRSLRCRSPRSRSTFPSAELDELRRRLAATRWRRRWPIEADDWSLGTPPGELRRLVEHWGGAYDWRAAEARLNAIEQVMVTVPVQDGAGTRVHALRAGTAGATPLLLIHGWPDSFLRFEKALPLLAARFDIVVPSIPGYGFSDIPAGDVGPTAVADCVRRADGRARARAVRRARRRHRLDDRRSSSRCGIRSGSPRCTSATCRCG